MPKQNDPTCFNELEIKILKLVQGDLPHRVQSIFIQVQIGWGMQNRLLFSKID